MQHISSFVHSFAPAEQLKAMKYFNIKTHRSIDSRIFSPWKSSIRSILRSTIYSKTYIAAFYWSNKSKTTIVIDSGASKS